MERERQDLVKVALKECRPLLIGALALSLAINLLSLALPLYSMQVFDRVLSSGSLDTLTMLTLIVIASVLFSSLLTVLRTVAFSQVSRWLDDRISGALVEKMIALSLHRPNIGTQPLRDLGTVRSFIASSAVASILDAPWAVVFFIVLYVINTTIGITVTIAAAILLCLAVLAQKAPSKLLGSASEAQVRSVQSLDAVIRNAEIVRAMGMTGSVTRIWREQNEKSLEDGYKAGNLGTLISNSTRTYRMGLQILISGLGAWLVINGNMSMGAIVAVNTLTGKALAPFDAAVPIYQGWTGIKKAHKRLLPVFEFEDSAARNLELPAPVGALKLSNVSFQEPSSKRWLLKALSLDFPAGSAIGVIGPSGSGKTTLCRLLVGVKSPTTGQVKLDGASLDQWKPEQLASAVGYLPQDVELFSGSVADNVARMRNNAEDQAIVRAAQLAEVHEFILGLPNGYQTDIGLNGASLSAGQRQRVALARCFFGHPKLLVLDEPNSNLDTEGEQALVQAMLNAKREGITVIVVAHRPTLLHHVDQIVVLKSGEVAMQGPAKEVMEALAGTNKSVQPLKIDRSA
ncbi:type I secretion system permease/ATPase [Ciceribacter sp. RN22]|uniref:type I secretion system permease/ATPase n=1 Tax=Ciceribacter sp. RN22 TaxID=2954932 RepID=UPI002093F817|nr:type I secretion system permease/ATPase [Ciceribacter sp. RN22]MCO6181035.1 type I secretion system permease/ATPase [Ciceribacter sp. RN22]